MWQKTKNKSRIKILVYTIKEQCVVWGKIFKLIHTRYQACELLILNMWYHKFIWFYTAVKDVQATLFKVNTNVKHHK